VDGISTSHAADESERLSLSKRLSRFGHRLCVKHDFFSLKAVRGKTSHIRRFYDFLAPFYDLIYPRSDAYLDSARHFVSTFVRPGDRVLDLGAGTGLLTLQMLGKALSVISFDLHDKMLLRGRQKTFKTIRRSNVPAAGTGFIQGNALCLPFAGDTFDMVASAFMLVYLDQQQKIAALREARRVLAPSGRLALLTFQGELHSRFTTRDEWRTIIEQAGFDEPTFDDFSEVFRTIHVAKA